MSIDRDFGRSPQTHLLGYLGNHDLSGALPRCFDSSRGRRKRQRWTEEARPWRQQAYQVLFLQLHRLLKVHDHFEGNFGTWSNRGKGERRLHDSSEVKDESHLPGSGKAVAITEK
jgi:hypothetical protein